jgi:hypothetical protein
MIGNISLLLGCYGQSFLFSALFEKEPSPWLLTSFFVLPWVVIFTVNFTKVPMFTYKTHLRICFSALLWWAGLTLLAEALWIAGLMHGLDRTQVVVGQIMMNLGWLSFIPVWRLYKRGDPASDYDRHTGA